ncbi:hypothetical protein [Nesterenkonia sp. K-15-9-6]|uniref:hypothetical protein n=1 Tax=Nesterenkonia sp. K-15-9-6 TaxID=3093918 RepID=UPI004043BA63
MRAPTLPPVRGARVDLSEVPVITVTVPRRAGGSRRRLMLALLDDMEDTGRAEGAPLVGSSRETIDALRLTLDGMSDAELEAA